LLGVANSGFLTISIWLSLLSFLIFSSSFLLASFTSPFLFPNLLTLTPIVNFFGVGVSAKKFSVLFILGVIFVAGVFLMVFLVVGEFSGVKVGVL
jgi:hypothetical protein